MRKQVEISDRFDSASETEWIRDNWELLPHTRDIKPFLIPAMLIPIVAGLVGIMYYTGTAGIRWRDG